MKRSLFPLLAALLLTSCVKQTDFDMQQTMYGHMLYTFRIVSYQEEGGKVVEAKDVQELQDDRFRFYQDGTAVRYQGGKMYWPFVPKLLRFKFGMLDGKITAVDMGGNKVIIEGTTDNLTIVQIPNPGNTVEKFRVYTCKAVPDGDGMDGN